MRRRTKNIKIFKSRYFVVFIVFLILVLVLTCLLWYFNPEIQQARQYKKDIKVLTKKIQKSEEKLTADTYGGETPEETYQMFLEALKNQDIELASKYFIIDRQKEYKELLTKIQNSEQWDEMMKDLLSPKNQKGKLEDKNTYVIEIINDQNVSVTTIVLKIPQSNIGTEKKLLSNIWKIVEF